MKIGDVVEVKKDQFGDKFPDLGVVKTLLPNDEVLVSFKVARQPKVRMVCDSCGWPGFLSMNGGTGEIVCMISGCGHEHGFSEYEEKFPLAKLGNITEQRKAEGMVQLKKSIRQLLEKAEEDGIITNGARTGFLMNLANL